MINVLVVDDEIDISLLFRLKFSKELEQGSIQLFFCHSGKDALLFLGNSKNPAIDLVLTDINMPGMTGLELTRFIKKSHADIVIFIITAYCNSINYAMSQEYGAAAFLTKPLEFSILKEKISNLLVKI